MRAGDWRTMEKQVNHVGTRRARSGLTGIVALGVALAASACGSYAGGGKSPSLLVIESLSATSGAGESATGNVLESDVLWCGGIVEDGGQAAIYIYLKDNSNPTAAATPSNLNWIQVDRYRVVFRRADGRNRPGVDVPYPFDGAVTFLAVNSPRTVDFTLVRAQAKLEAPLAELRTQGGAVVLSTIADVTFYGKDLAGNAVQVTGSISVNFADWTDADCG